MRSNIRLYILIFKILLFSSHVTIINDDDASVPLFENIDPPTREYMKIFYFFNFYYAIQ